MGKIKWAERASWDLQDIHEYISKDSKIYATRFIKSLITATKKLESIPLCGRTVPEFESEWLREIIYRNYRIVYRIINEDYDIQILTVAHAARDMNKLYSIEWEK